MGCTAASDNNHCTPLFDSAEQMINTVSQKTPTTLFVHNSERSWKTGLIPGKL